MQLTANLFESATAQPTLATIATAPQGTSEAANDRAIKQQEHADVKANGGHLTPAEQKQLNQEENANSTLIRDEKHPQ